MPVWKFDIMEWLREDFEAPEGRVMQERRKWRKCTLFDTGLCGAAEKWRISLMWSFRGMVSL